MKSHELAEIFKEIAQILEIKGDNPFRIRAYERAAERIEEVGDELEALAEKDELTKLPGIGEDLSSKIKEFISTGSLKVYEKLKKDTPEGLLTMLNIQGLGPKTVRRLYQELNIKTIDKLEKYAKEGKLGQLEGIKQKTQDNILRGIEILREGSSQTLLLNALEIAQDFVKELKKIKEIDKVEIAGSLRRRKEAVRDIDILVSSKKPDLVIDKFTKLSLVKDVLTKGSTKSSVVAIDNIQVDLRVVEEKSFGAALLYFTGSKEFNIRLRSEALKKDCKINEYGVFSEGDRALAGKTEEDLFSFMKMSYIQPELREDRGEIEAALKGTLPKLVELKDIKGELHTHTYRSDGINTAPEIAQGAKKLGYKYIGISDHSQSLKIAGGLSVREIHKNIDEIRKLNQSLKGIRILCGSEVDISQEGKLDYPDSILKELDFVIAAIHTNFKQPRAQQTKRIVSACKNEYVNIIAHLTGILRGQRDPYEVDLDEVLKAALDNKVALEINCHPQRYDLDDLGAKKAKEKGVKLILNTDAHLTEQLWLMGLGISVARRGWLEKKDLINCMNLEELLKWLEK